MSMFRSLLPESLFPRKLPADVEQRLRLAQARADEAIVRTHVANALLFVDALAPEVPFERALEVYVREMALPEAAASVVLTRALVALGDGLLPSPAERDARVARDEATRRAAVTAAASERVVVDLPRPRLRLDDAEAARRRPA
jgi:hypothetical protein